MSWRDAAVAALAAVLVALGPAAPAQAHTELDSALPTAGATLVKTPGNVQLNFTEPIDAELAQVVVRGPDGRDLTAGPPQQSGPGLLQPITATRQAGTLQVAYRVISLDGHPVSGTYTFEVMQGDPDAAGSAGGGSGAAGAGGVSDVSLTGPLLGTGAVVLLVAAGAVLAHRRRRRPAGPGTPSTPQPTPPAP